jgi:hypothetical protein
MYLGLLKILWSDGKIEDCKYGVKGQADIVVTPDQSVDYSPLHVGSFVVRGNLVNGNATGCPMLQNCRQSVCFLCNRSYTVLFLCIRF